jgi:hypothetical protein
MDKAKKENVLHPAQTSPVPDRPYLVGCETCGTKSFPLLIALEPATSLVRDTEF